jgi:type II secretory pathway pseudopilin PulG
LVEPALNSRAREADSHGDMFRRVAAEESGFTIIEVLVAAVVLLVGIMGVVTIVDAATANSTATKAREQGVALQREIIDAARSIPYDQLGPASAASGVQAVAGLGDSNVGAGGWTIRRRGVTYSVAVGACSVDDPTDGYGNHDAATFCATGTGAGTPAQCRSVLAGTGSVRGNGAATGSTVGDCGIDLNLDGRVDNLTEQQVGLCSIGPCGSGTAADPAPDDYKRVVVLVTWDRGSGDRFALQSETLPNPGLASAPSVVDLTAAPDSSEAAPIAAGTSTINFTARTTGKVASVAWYLDGTPKANAAQSTTTPDTWTFPWALQAVTTTPGAQPAAGEVLDGVYVVSAKAFDRYDQFGSAKARTVVLNRRQPFAPANFSGGRNLRRGIVEFEWSPNKERDIKTYRVYRDDAGGSTLVCDTRQTSCQDTSPPSGSPLHYRAVAVDTANGALREGDAATKDVLDTVVVPDPPQNLRLTSTDANGALHLAWDAPTTGGVDFYRIYRDGQRIDDRYDRTSGTTYTDTSPLPGTHDYYVTAVGSGFSESNFSNRLTVGP